MRCLELAVYALLSTRETERSVTSAWRACTSEPARIARGGRAIQPGGSSTPLAGDPGELLSHTFWVLPLESTILRRLEMNTQDSNEDVLFRQEMRTLREGPGASLTSGEPRERSAEPLRSRRKSRGVRWDLSWLKSKGGVCSGGARRTDLSPVLKKTWPKQVSAARSRSQQATGVCDLVFHLT
jgi:hypothetical protein